MAKGDTAANPAESTGNSGQGVVADKPALPPSGDADFPMAMPSPRHDQKVKEVKDGNYDLVLVGDSITHTLDKFGGKYAPLEAVWNKYFAPHKALNLGYSGYRTEGLLWNLRNGELDFRQSPKLFMLLAGTNNLDDRHFEIIHTPEQVLAGTRAIVEEIKKRHPTSKIVILRIFPRGGDADTSVSPPDFHSSAATIAAARRAGELTRELADDKQVFWLDLAHVFLKPDGRVDNALLWDLLHPSPAGAEAWAKAVEPTLAQLMGEPSVAAPLPASCIPVPRTDGDYDWMARHQAVLAARSTQPTTVFLGDSITHYLGGEPAATGAFLSTHRGEAFLAAVSAAKAGPVLNAGFGGDRTEHLLWRLDHGELDGIHPKRVVLMIGTNNILSGADAVSTAAGVRACLLRIRGKMPEAKIALMGILPAGNPATNPHRATVRDTNIALKSLAQEAKCDFLDIGDQFLDAEGIIPAALMNDAIHPTLAGYEIWQKALLPLLGKDGAQAPDKQ